MHTNSLVHQCPVLSDQFADHDRGVRQKFHYLLATEMLLQKLVHAIAWSNDSGGRTYLLIVAMGRETVNRVDNSLYIRDEASRSETN